MVFSKMKDLKYNKKILNETKQMVEFINSYQESFLKLSKKLRKEYENELLKAQIKLIESIAEGESLDVIELKTKYLNSSEKKISKKKDKQSLTTTEEDILDTCIVEGVTYYFSQNSGVVYNEDSTVVGSYVDGQIVLKK